jgi:type I restriction enzyme, S subunit
MSFPKYPKYKDSGVEWLGEVPEHWGASRVRWLCQRYAGGTPDKTKTDYWENGTIPWLNSGAVNDRLITEPSALITDDAFANSSAKWIPRGSLLMALAGQGKTKGMVAQLGFPATCNQSMAALVPGSQVAARYLYYWLDSNYQNIRNMAGGDLRDGLNLELIGDIACPLPALPEQAAIATFLDRETAKIDALIAEQQRLIELLQEKRQAVISHAVTKGLNPDAPMKDSGIEWLGQVPQHWEEFPLGALLRLKHGFAFDGSRFSDTGEYILMTPGNFQERGGFRPKEPEKYYEGHDFPSEFILASGQLLVAMTEQALGLLGSALFVPDQAVYLHNQRVGLVQGLRDDRLDLTFLYHVFNSARYRAEVSTTASGSKVRHTSPGKMLAVRVCLPPLSEQRQLVVAIDKAFAEVDTLCAEAQSAIALLQERRSGLISAVVTGQIDVRGLAESEAA